MGRRIAQDMLSRKMMRTVAFAVVVVACFIVVTDAGASFPEDDGIVCAKIGTADSALIKTGLGSGTCTEGATTATAGTYYKGTCDNSAGVFKLTPYSTSDCSGAAGTTVDYGLPSTSTTSPLGSSVEYKSCNKCPPENIEANTIVYIVSFFFIVFVYLILVCCGMYALSPFCGNMGCEPQ